MKPKCLYDVQCTFYGYDDNSGEVEEQHGSAIIAYPKIHKYATEDVGTYEDPSTFAAAPALVKPGTKIYVPRLLKYYIMEDSCMECIVDWKKRIKRFDLYIGGQKHGGEKLLAREKELTIEPEVVIINPPPYLPVNEEPLFNGNMD